MTAVSGKHKVAAALAALYGIVAIVGGTIGYAVAGSVASIIAGGASGLLLILCAVGTIYFKPLWCLLGAAVISIALLIQFLPKVVHYLNGTAETLAPAPVAMTVGGLIVLFASAFALGTKGNC